MTRSSPARKTMALYVEERLDGRTAATPPLVSRRTYWFTVVPIERPAEGTDLWAFQNGFVSLTPLRVDLTHHDDLEWASEAKPWK